MTGLRVKKGTSGPSAQYIGRSKVLRKLQLSLPDFRRLCILKGIYPRVPRKKPSGREQTFYHSKDISFLAQEPLIWQLRAQKAFAKRVRKAVGRRELSTAKALKDREPRYTFHHLLTERYPTFLEALADLDDCLSTLALFAALPADDFRQIPANVVRESAEILDQFHLLISASQTLRKVFVSIKGYYLQATVCGVNITWLLPHAFCQNLPDQVDYRVMLTFLELYRTLGRFVCYKLFLMGSLAYPPAIHSQMEKAGLRFLAMSCVPLASTHCVSADKSETPEARGSHADTPTSGLAGVSCEQPEIEPADQQHEKSSSSSSSSSAEEVKEDKTQTTEQTETADAAAVAAEDSSSSSYSAPLFTSPSAATAEAETQGKALAESQSLTEKPRLQSLDHAQPTKVAKASTTFDKLRDSSKDAKKARCLFRGLVFFLAKEVPRVPFTLVIRSAGGTVGWQDEFSPMAEADPSITHHVVDRPLEFFKKAVSAADGVTPLSRDYIQPQWVMDCFNARAVLPLTNYRPSETLPPHLSPFVDDYAAGYIPQHKHALDILLKQTGESRIADKPAEADEADNEDKLAKIGAEDDNGVGLENGASLSEADEEEGAGDIDTTELETQKFEQELADERNGKTAVDQSPAQHEQHSPQRKGFNEKAFIKAKADINRKRRTKKEEEELARRKAMMTKKHKRLLEKIEFGEKRRQAEARRLDDRRRQRTAKCDDRRAAI